MPDMQTKYMPNWLMSVLQQHGPARVRQFFASHVFLVNVSDIVFIWITSDTLSVSPHSSPTKVYPMPAPHSRRTNKTALSTTQQSVLC